MIVKIASAAPLIAVLHDTPLALGLFSIFDKEIPMTVIAALLTRVGSIVTSGLMFLTVAALFWLAGPALHGFSFALFCGIIVGTLFWHNWADQRRPARALAVAVARPARMIPSKAAE